MHRNACMDGKQSTPLLPVWFQGPDNCPEQSVSWPRGDEALMSKGPAAHTYPPSLLVWLQSCRKALLFRNQWREVILALSAQGGAFYQNRQVCPSLALGEYCKMVFFLPYSHHTADLGHQTVNPSLGCQAETFLPVQIGLVRSLHIILTTHWTWVFRNVPRLWR